MPNSDRCIREVSEEHGHLVYSIHGEARSAKNPSNGLRS
jgi:hypothetical protein